MRVLILDNGAGSIKCGYAYENSPKVVPNCVMKAKTVKTRVFIGSQIEECKDLSSLYYQLPFQRGYLAKWDTQKAVWDYLFDAGNLKVDFDDTHIVCTEPQFNFSSIQEVMNEILFEEYGFASAFRTTAADLSRYKYAEEYPEAQCTLVVDTGFSFSHIVPFHKEQKMIDYVKRIDVGGKMLTNHLKDMISYRQINVMDENYVINQCKEDVCFVSTNLSADLKKSRLKGAANPIAQRYVLPDYTQVNRGYVAPQDEKLPAHTQVLMMNNERFMIPELLFHPSDVNIPQMGLSEAICEVIRLAPAPMRPHLYSNIVLTGGSVALPGLPSRIRDDVRQEAATEFDVHVHTPDAPGEYAWYGGQALARQMGGASLKSMSVTREEYEEKGQNVCFEKFTTL